MRLKLPECFSELRCPCRRRREQNSNERDTGARKKRYTAATNLISDRERDGLIAAEDRPKWSGLNPHEAAYTLDWINCFAEQVWENMEASLKLTIENRVMPALSERLPALLRPCSLVTFSLGKKPPRLGPLQVAPFDTSDYHGVQLDIDVDGDLDLEFTMRIGALEHETGVKNLSIRGTLCLVTESGRWPTLVAS